MPTLAVAIAQSGAGVATSLVCWALALGFRAPATGWFTRFLETRQTQVASAAASFSSARCLGHSPPPPIALALRTVRIDDVKSRVAYLKVKLNQETLKSD